MADNVYSVEVVVRSGSRTVDKVELDDEDYGALMNRLTKWARHSEAMKDL